MEYIRVTKENIDLEDICCAMSNNQSLKKKKWLIDRFDDGLVFLKSKQRGKCFIEYIPCKKAWAPIDANDYMYINCLWVSGSLKGHGYSNDLLDECIKDAKKKKLKGLCILSSCGRKKEFLADPKYLEYKGFMIADKSVNDISLMYLPFTKNATIPKFKSCAKDVKIKEKGFVLYYTDQCPFTRYWVTRVITAAKENKIKLKVIQISDLKTAQSLPSPVTTYALFKDGEFITHAIQTDKKFIALAKKRSKNEKE